MIFKEIDRNNEELRERAKLSVIPELGNHFISIDDYTINYILMDEDEIVGGIDFRLSIPEADLLFIYIRKDLRGKGYSKTLLDESLKELSNKGVHKVFLEVDNTNSRALSLYNSYGFKRISVRKYYYVNGNDAIIMMKEF